MASRDHSPTRYRARSAAYSDTGCRSERTASVVQGSSVVSAFECLRIPVWPLSGQPNTQGWLP
jgi:hypothetical protein